MRFKGNLKDKEDKGKRGRRRRQREEKRRDTREGKLEKEKYVLIKAAEEEK